MKEKSQRTGNVVAMKNVEKKPPDRPSDFVCQRCNRVFKWKSEMGLHQRKCLKIEKGKSFLEYHEKMNAGYDISDKILPPPPPPTQPLLDENVTKNAAKVCETAVTYAEVVAITPTKQINQQERVEEHQHPVLQLFGGRKSTAKNIFFCPNAGLAPIPNTITQQLPSNFQEQATSSVHMGQNEKLLSATSSLDMLSPYGNDITTCKLSCLDITEPKDIIREVSIMSSKSKSGIVTNNIQTHMCSLCSRNFKTQRGLKQHFNSCLKKNAEFIENTYKLPILRNIQNQPKI